MTPAETVSRWAMFLDKPIEVEDAIAALVKAERERERAEAAYMGVKKLEWRDQRGHAFPDMWDAKSVCGVYQIEERSASDSPAYVVTGPMYSFIADVDALEYAKAAAQADYERRILSALTPAPVRAEGEAITDEMLRRAYSVPLIEGRGPDVFDRERLRFALAAALKAEDSLHG